MNKYLRFKELKSVSDGVEKFGVTFVNFSLVHNLKLNWDNQFMRARIDYQIHQSEGETVSIVFFKKFDSERHFIFWRKELADFSKNESMYFDLGINEA
ncbi:MAG: hypothetical protein ACKOWQ_06185 [Aquirufa sp.]